MHSIEFTAKLNQRSFFCEMEYSGIDKASLEYLDGRHYVSSAPIVNDAKIVYIDALDDTKPFYTDKQVEEWALEYGINLLLAGYEL